MAEELITMKSNIFPREPRKTFSGLCMLSWMHIKRLGVVVNKAALYTHSIMKDYGWANSQHHYGTLVPYE